MENFRGARAILSGPAGGVVGYAVTGQRETQQALIGFDMGGTSTDVSRYDGNYEHVIESTTAGVTIQAPQLDINTGKRKIGKVDVKGKKRRMIIVKIVYKFSNKKLKYRKCPRFDIRKSKKSNFDHGPFIEKSSQFILNICLL